MDSLILVWTEMLERRGRSLQRGIVPWIKSDHDWKSLRFVTRVLTMYISADKRHR